MAGKRTFIGKEEAFKDFINNIYPSLNTKDKKPIKDAVSRFNKKGSVTEEKIAEILKNHGYFIKKKEVWSK